MFRAKPDSCADNLHCGAAWHPQTACQIYDCLGQADGHWLEVELELHANAGIDVRVVAATDMLAHLRTVLNDELGAKPYGQVVLLDACKGTHAVVAVHGNLFIDVVQGTIVLAPFLRLAVYAEANAVLAPVLLPGSPATGILLVLGLCRRGRRLSAIFERTFPELHAVNALAAPSLGAGTVAEGPRRAVKASLRLDRPASGSPCRARWTTGTGSDVPASGIGRLQGLDTTNGTAGLPYAEH